jgi:hypothetical protein
MNESRFEARPAGGAVFMEKHRQPVIASPAGDRHFGRRSPHGAGHQLGIKSK